MKTTQQSYPALAEALGVTEIYLKREDQHHFGSHKGRSIPHMIELYQKAGTTNFVISSSGNAALAALLYIQTHNRNKPESPLSLAIFVGQKIPADKLAVLTNIAEDPRIIIKQVDNPKQRAFQMDRDGKAKFLRQSNDDNALLGYEELATELSKIPNLGAVFIPTSSGTTAQALGETFAKLGLHIQIHIVQTTTCHPIVSALTPTVREETTRPRPVVGGDVPTGTEGVNGLPTSLATAIVDNIAHRKQKVVDTVKQSNGSGWIVTDDEIRDAIKIVEQTTNILISPNSALSVAGLQKALKNNWKTEGVTACLITGR